MSRSVLSLCSVVLCLGAFGAFFFSIYCNFSMAQLEIPGGRPIKVNWVLPSVDLVVEYNDYSVLEEDVFLEPEVVEVVEEERFPDPEIVNVEGVVTGDDVNGGELVDHYGFPTPDAKDIKTIDFKSYIDNFHLERILAEFDEKVSGDIVTTEKSSSKKKIHPPKEERIPPPSPPVKPPLIARTAPSVPLPPKIPKKGTGQEGSYRSFPSPFLALASGFIKQEFFRRTLRAHSAVDGRELDFQFVPDHDRNQVFSSDEKGVVEILPAKRLVDGVLRGRLVSPEHIRTAVNLPLLEGKEASFDIPLIDEETFERYRDKGGDFQGGFLLVWIPKKVEDVDINSDYSFRIFLDEEFREVSREDGYSYILFMGIQSGVTILSHLLEDSRVAEKPVYIAQDEILYDFAPVEKGQYETFELFQKNLFSGKRVELPLGEREIRYFNRKITPTKKGLNRYEIKRPPISIGARSYLKLDHLDGILHVGYKGNRQLEVPNQDFIENIIDGFGLDELSDACLIQLNFSDAIVHLETRLDSLQESEGFDLIYLNSDGTFEEMPSLRTEKAFILGESSGVLPTAVKYADGRWELFKSFCSPGSYLIEQL